MFLGVSSVNGEQSAYSMQVLQNTSVTPPASRFKDLNHLKGMTGDPSVQLKLHIVPHQLCVGAN